MVGKVPHMIGMAWGHSRMVSAEKKREQVSKTHVRCTRRQGGADCAARAVLRGRRGAAQAPHKRCVRRGAGGAARSGRQGAGDAAQAELRGRHGAGGLARSAQARSEGAGRAPGGRRSRAPTYTFFFFWAAPTSFLRSVLFVRFLRFRKAVGECQGVSWGSRVS